VRHDTEAGRHKFASPRFVRRLVAAVLAVFVMVGAGAGAWFWRTHASGEAPSLSLVVLPFDNLGGDARASPTI
jgi:hypothetical protein